MTKKDYENIAGCLKSVGTLMGASPIIRIDVINALCNMFEQDNPKFNRIKFIDYIRRDN